LLHIQSCRIPSSRSPKNLPKPQKNLSRFHHKNCTKLFFFGTLENKNRFLCLPTFFMKLLLLFVVDVNGKKKMNKTHLNPLLRCRVWAVRETWAYQKYVHVRMRENLSPMVPAELSCCAYFCEPSGREIGNFRMFLLLSPSSLNGLIRSFNFNCHHIFLSRKNTFKRASNYRLCGDYRD
jgi:hypothetical protein